MSPRKRGVGLFLSTPSGWRATAAAVAEPAAALDISIHALRVEGDTMLGSACRLKMHFYPRPPGGGRRAKTVRPTALLYFYPRPPGGGRLLLFIFLAFLLCISIHALRVEGDFNNSNLDLIIVISIHALRVEGDSPSPPSFVTVPISIHALRVEGDWSRAFPRIMQQHFYPRPPGGGRHKCQVFYNSEKRSHFYPRPPGGGRPRPDKPESCTHGVQISIHALRVEGDR